MKQPGRQPEREPGAETEPGQLGIERDAEEGIALRALTAFDVNAILVLASETAEAPQWSSQQYERILRSDAPAALSRFGFVAHCGSALAGFAVASLFRMEKAAEIETIVVHRLFRRRGIGSRLLIASKAFAQAAGANILRLEVRESNGGAIALYLGQEFHLTGRRRSYYSGPFEDALLLEASLKEFPAARPD